MASTLNNDFQKAVFTLQSEAGRILEARRSEAFAKQNKSRFLVDYRPFSFTYVDNSWDWSSRTVINHNSLAYDKKEEKESHKMAIILGSIIALAASFLLGYAVKQYAQANKTARITNQFLTEIEKLPNTGVNTDFKADALQFLQYQKENDSLHLGKWQNYAVSSIGGIIGGALCVGGGLSAAPWVITAGAVAILCGSILGAYTMAVHWDDATEIQENCKKMIVSPDQACVEGACSLADKLLIQMSYLDQHLCWHNKIGSNPSSYVPVNEAAKLSPDSREEVAQISPKMLQDWRGQVVQEGYQSLFPQYFHSAQDQIV